MTETLMSIKQRNSCRAFKPTPLKEDQTKQLVEAALAAPSARNLQPWHIIVVTDKKQIEELDAEGMTELSTLEDKQMYNLMKERGGTLFYNAPFLMIILAEEASKWALLDCGIQCQNVTLAAQSMGLGSCILGLAGVPLEGKNGKELQKRFKFPAGYKFAVAVAVGEVEKGKEPHGHDHTKVTYIG
ncbi:MAG: nitroreductase family protein [Oscillospiraceae bacterium]|nr:nitroreductase family protein [Oscillospiraceae bacterium]MCL2279835.1 nitroreductase family protein [Oscillospiraceae bacterium]